MQNQSISGQNSLQQTSSSLQQNSSSLQQSGTPTTSSNVFTILSQQAQSGGLKVQSAQTDPSLSSQTYSPAAPFVSWLLPVVLVVLAVAVFVVSRKIRNQISETELEMAVQAEPVPAVAAKKPATSPKSGKKTTRRKRQNKR